MHEFSRPLVLLLSPLVLILSPLVLLLNPLVLLLSPLVLLLNPLVLPDVLSYSPTLVPGTDWTHPWPHTWRGPDQLWFRHSLHFTVVIRSRNDTITQSAESSQFDVSTNH